MIQGRIPGRDEHPIIPILLHYGFDLQGHILELGPGNGQLEEYVMRASGLYTGVDKDPNAGVVLLDYDLHPESIPRGSYDGVWAKNSVGAEWESLPRLAAALNERMPPHAWSFISLWTGKSTPDQESLAFSLFERYGWYVDDFDAGTNQSVMVRL